MITREIYIEKKVATSPIYWVYGTTGATISFTIKDVTIPTGATIKFYSLSPAGARFEADGTKSGNAVNFSPVSGFFSAGKNTLQCEISATDTDLFSFAVTVNCESNNKYEGLAQSAKQLRDYVEQINENTEIISYVKANFIDPMREYISLEVGGYGSLSAAGEQIYNDSKYYVRSGYVYLKKGTIIEKKSHQFKASFYSTANYLTFTDGFAYQDASYTLTSDCYARISVKGTDEFATSDINDYVNVYKIGKYFIENDEDNPITDRIEKLEAFSELPRGTTGINPYEARWFDGLAYSTIALASTTDYNEWISEWDKLLTEFPDWVTKANLGKDASNTYDIFSYTIDCKMGNYTTSTGKEEKITCLYIGGIHGGEKLPMRNDLQMFRWLLEKQKSGEYTFMLSNCIFKIIPVMNPWGYANSHRYNSNHVDLNRNFNTSDWHSGTSYPGTDMECTYGTSAGSEAETQIAQNFIQNNTGACFLINRHGTGTISVTKCVGYIKSIFSSDRYVADAVSRTLTVLINEKYPWIVSRNNEVKGKNLFGIKEYTVVGTADTYATESIASHSILLETTDHPGGDKYGTVSTTESNQTRTAAVQYAMNILEKLIYARIQYNVQNSYNSRSTATGTGDSDD